MCASRIPTIDISGTISRPSRTCSARASSRSALGRGRAARQVSGELVTGNYFSGLGVRAELGRTLQQSDDVAPLQHPVVVISHGLWRRDFSADPDIVGKTIELNNVPLTVVGVADRSFHGTVVSYDIEVFIPIMMAPQFRFNFERLNTVAPLADPLSDRYTAMVSPHGYLRPGTSMASARAELEAMWVTLSRDRTLDEAGQQLRVVRFWQSPTGGQTVHAPDADGVERHGPAGTDDRLRQHRGPRAGARRFTAR